MLVAGLALLALAASITGILNGFTYDDLPMIVQNPHVHDLHAIGRLLVESYWPAKWGGSLYRPLTTAAFTVEWAIGHGSPLVFHLTNIALYIAVTLAVYALARRLLPLGAAWCAAAIFAVHPVHVEAVANVVGQSELLAALFVVTAVTYYVARRRSAQTGGLKPAPTLHQTGGTVGAAFMPPVKGMFFLFRKNQGLRPWTPDISWGDVAVLSLLYAAGCLTKEHAIVLPALLLAAEFTVVAVPGVQGRSPWFLLNKKNSPPSPLGEGGRGGEGRNSLWPVAIALGITGVGFLALRSSILHGLIGEPTPVPLGRVSWLVRWWTMLGVVPEWARLFVWPAHLAAIYSPSGTPIRDGIDPVAFLGLCLAGATIALAVALRRKSPATAFGIFWIAIALLPVSNLIVPSAVLLAERTLFLPSVGAVIVFGSLIARVRKFGTIPSRWAIPALGLVLGAGVWRSATRQPVWHDTRRLFAQSVIDEPLSYRAHFSLMGELFDAGQWGLAEREGRIAIRLYDGDPWLYEMLAYHYFVAGQCQLAEPLVERTLALDPQYADARHIQTECRVQRGTSR